MKLKYKFYSVRSVSDPDLQFSEIRDNWIQWLGYSIRRYSTLFLAALYNLLNHFQSLQQVSDAFHLWFNALKNSEP